MTLELSDRPVTAAGLTSAEARATLAVWLYQSERLTFGDASELAQISVDAFAAELTSRGVPIGYNLADLASDVATLRALGRL